MSNTREDYIKVVVKCDNVMHKNLNDLKKVAKEKILNDEIMWVEAISPAHRRKEKIYVAD